MIRNINYSTVNYSFCSKKAFDETAERGQVEYSHKFFLDQEREAAKSHIQHYIEKSEADEVLKHKTKGIFSQLENFVKTKIKKIK